MSYTRLDSTFIDDKKNDKRQPINSDSATQLPTNKTVSNKTHKKSSWYDFFPIPKQNSLCGETYFCGRTIFRFNTSSLGMQYGIKTYDTIMQPSYFIDRVCYRFCGCCDSGMSYAFSDKCCCPINTLAAIPICGVMLTWYGSKIPFYVAAFSGCCIAGSIGYGIQCYQNIHQNNYEGPSPQLMDELLQQPMNITPAQASKWQQQEMLKKWLEEDDLLNIYNFIFKDSPSPNQDNLSLLLAIGDFFGLQVICLSIRYNVTDKQVDLLQRKNLIHHIGKVISLCDEATKKEICSPLYEALVTDYKDGYKLIEYLCEENYLITFNIIPFKCNDYWFRSSFLIWMYFNYLSEEWSEQECFDKAVLLKYYDRATEEKSTALYVAETDRWESLTIDTPPKLLEMSTKVAERAQESKIEMKNFPTIQKILSTNISEAGLIQIIGQYTGALFSPTYQEEKRTLSRQSIFSLSKKKDFLGWREFPEEYIKVAAEIEKKQDEYKRKEDIKDSHITYTGIY